MRVRLLAMALGGITAIIGLIATRAVADDGIRPLAMALGTVVGVAGGKLVTVRSARGTWWPNTVTTPRLLWISSLIGCAAFGLLILGTSGWLSLFASSVGASFLGMVVYAAVVAMLSKPRIPAE